MEAGVVQNIIACGSFVVEAAAECAISVPRNLHIEKRDSVSIRRHSESKVEFIAIHSLQTLIEQLQRAILDSKNVVDVPKPH